jgi:hypothetical protein
MDRNSESFGWTLVNLVCNNSRHPHKPTSIGELLSSHV